MRTRMFVLQPPRHPLLRALFALAGLVVFGSLLVFGFFAFLALAAVGGVFMLIRGWRNRHGRDTPATDRHHETQVIEGEYVIVHERRNAPHS